MLGDPGHSSRSSASDSSADRARTAHRRIYLELLEEIASGRFGPSGQLPTEFELVERFGVSRATVSRAVQDLARDGLVERRRGAGTFVRRVGEEAEQASLALFVPVLEPGRPLAYVEGQMRHFLVEEAARAGFLPQLQPLAGGEDRTLRERFAASVEQVIEARPRAVLYYPAELPAELADLNLAVVERLEGADIEVLLVDRDVVQPPARSSLPRIGFDNRLGAARLAAHLVSRGCRRLAFLALDVPSSSVAERIEGFHSGVLPAGEGAAEVRVWRVPRPSRAVVEEAVVDFGADALVGKSDLFAAEAGRHLLDLGRRIGVDVRLAGFDDDPVAAVLPVPLTTVRLDARTFAATAVHCVRGRLDGSLPRTTQVLVDGELVARASTLGPEGGGEEPA